MKVFNQETNDVLDKIQIKIIELIKLFNCLKTNVSGHKIQIQYRYH